uniref:Pc118, similar to salivary secreted protein n=1 Tax=Panstrongylus chinai TaxID=156444 RepID=A0A286P0W2_9HEMI|nr:Pc118, similar to salivary secreted protein [Panstrongylus chinai]
MYCVVARPNTDGLSMIDAATSDSTSSLLIWQSMGTITIKDRLSFDENLWNTSFHFGNNSAQVAASLGSQRAERRSDYVKQGLQTATSHISRGVDQGSGLATQVLGLIRTLPGFLSVIGKTAVNMGIGLGTNSRNAVNTFEDRKLSFINSLSQMGTNALSSIVNSRTSMEQTSGTNAGKSIVGPGSDILQQLI